MKNRIFLLLLLWISGYSTYAQFDHFQISIWSFSYDNAPYSYHAGINTTIGNSMEFYQLFKEYGFNTIQVEYQLMPGDYYNPHYVSSNPSKAFLDRADSLGLKIILDCPDIYVDRRIDSMYELIPNYTQYNPTNSINGLNYYGNHPAIAGFAVCDEPTTVVFSDIASYFSDIQNYNEELIRLANLLPSYGKDTSFGFPGVGFENSYPQYVENFIITTHPNILSFDSYPIHFFNSCNDCLTLNQVWPNSFYFNFDVISKASENHQIPFVYIPTFLSAKDPNTDTLKNVSEMRYVVYGGLIHGAKGLNYWHAGANYNMWDKIKTEIKEFLRQIHHQILDHEDVLMSLHYKGSYHVKDVSTLFPNSTNGEYIPTHMQWSAFGNDTYTQEIFNQANPITAISGYSLDSLAISYLFDDNGGKYFWVDNKSFKSSLQIQLNLNYGCSIADVMNDQRCPQGGNVVVQLLPGEAKLFRAFFTNETDTISSSVTWNQKRVQGQDIVVDSLATLTIKDTLFITDNARIVVRPGGELIVDGGTLTSACAGEMWQGIEVEGNCTKQQQPQYQGKVELLNGATIENAMCGIRTGLSSDSNFATTGGIIEADQALFRNNRRAVEINSYKYYTPSGNVAKYVSSFSRCTFTVNNSNLFSANNVAFGEHVKLWDVRDIPFKGCTFNNLTSSNSSKGRGIYADDAGLIVNTRCTRPLMDNECVCPENLSTYSSFSGFSTAIEVNTTGNPYEVKVDEALFYYNGTGVSICANNYVTVTRNTFNLQSAPNSLTSTGLSLDNCSGYKVEGNRFHKASKSSLFWSTGITINNSGVTNNSIYRNIFDTLEYGIRVLGTNGNTDGGLQMTAGDFSYDTYGIIIASGATVSPWQGSLKKGADNLFVNIQNYSINNIGSQLITYYHSPNYAPGNVTTSNVGVVGTAAVNPRTSTLCNNGGGHYPFTLTGFQSEMESFMEAVGNDEDGGASTTDMCQSLSETYYDAVRALMADSILDINGLEQWHAAAQSIADPYSLTETRFMLGYSEPFTADADNAELANYADFHALKLALRNAGVCDTPQQDGHINWYALTPAQIAQLQVIAERNAGRASVMAKGVLCFFHGICYEDEWDTAPDDTAQYETRSHHSAQSAEPQTDDRALSVHPNPTDGILHIELSGAGIANVALYDLQGRIVVTNNESPQRGTATMNLQNVPAGVYLLRVTDTDGKEHHRKIVKR